MDKGEEDRLVTFKGGRGYSPKLFAAGTDAEKVYDLKSTNEENGKQTALINTFEKSLLNYDGDDNIGSDSWQVFTNVDDDYDFVNGIDLWYYKDLEFTNIADTSAYLGEEKKITIDTDFKFG